MSPEQLAVLQNEDNGHTVIAVVSTFTAIGFIFVCTRLYARLILIRNIGLEDYCILISFVRTLCLQIPLMKLTNLRLMLSPWLRVR